MMKKVLLLASAFSAGAFAAKTDVPIQLDVIVRDFQPSHSDFENFSEEYVTPKAGNAQVPDGFASGGEAMYAWGKPGYDATWYGLSAYHNTCGNKASFKYTGAGVPLGKDGLPMVANTVLPAYLQNVSTSTEILTYGQCKSSAIAGVVNQRGYGENTAQFTGVKKNSCTGGMEWENEVLYTPGMVNRYLTFDTDSTGEPISYLDNVHIQKLNELCDNYNFAQWYEDVDGVNKRSNVLLILPVASDDAKYKELDYNYNNGGYFPLDVIDAATQIRTGAVDGTDQWGPQSFSIFCPPYDYQWAKNQQDFLGQNTYNLCNAWNTYGGARGLSPEVATNIAEANGTLGYQHLRNYNFTMMGYAKFRYYKSNNTDESNQEIFEFAGDDDMWIFVDGVLAVDLGGTHLATPGVVNIRELAQNNHGCNAGEPLATVQQKANACGADGQWADGSWHHLHFFYADRQTDGSNLYIRANLAELAPSQYGQPRIMEAELVKNDAGEFDTYIYVQTQLSDASIASIASANGAYFPILDKRGTDTLAYKVTGFKFVQKTSKGYEYEIKGSLCKDAACTIIRNPAFGDSLTFNYIPDEDHPDAYNNQFAAGITVTSKANAAVDKYIWGPITTVTMSQSTTIVPADTTINRPPFDETQLPSGDLNEKQTGEIIISVLPSSYSNSQDQSKWIADSLKYYTEAGSSVSGAQVINSKTGNGTGAMSEARCSTTNGVENCVSFSFVTDEAFRVNVRIFDHLGHFVNQYNQELSPEQFNKVTGSYAESNCSALDETTTMGSIGASVKMYPVSQNGRKLGTGAYIYQISLIEYPQPHCVNVSGQLNWTAGQYRRTEYKQTRGFRRTNK